MTGTSKLQKLIEALGDLSEYDFTGWVLDNSNVPDWGKSRSWAEKMYPFAGLGNVPLAMEQCHCSTPIKNNYLIIYRDTKRLEFVGSKCIQNWKDTNDKNLLRKRCFDCLEPTTCNTKRCKKCRKYCKLHKQWHDDNSVHTKENIPRITQQMQISTLRQEKNIDYGFYDSDDDSDNDSDCDSEYNYDQEDDYTYEAYFEHLAEVAEEEAKPFNVRFLSFGRYKNKSPLSLVGKDDAYLQWLVSSDELTETDKNIMGKLLLKTSIQFGKYRGKTFEWIKHNQEGYFSWLKRNVDKSYIPYL